MAKQTFQFIDIGANLTDGMYNGVYHGKIKHKKDLDKVLNRSWSHHLSKIMITAGSLSEAKEALAMAETDERLYCTVGVHPTRCNEFEGTKTNNNDENKEKNENEDGDNKTVDPKEYMNQLLEIAKEGIKKKKIVAIGEFGLDYERLFFCEKEIQLKYFDKQFELCEKTGLPLFLHSRRSTDDLINILLKNRHRWKTGVVHSFTDNLNDAKKLLKIDGIYIGLNGCSMKTQENLDVIKEIPIEKIMIETDCPWCGVKKTHASHKYVQTHFKENKIPKKGNENTDLCQQFGSEEYFLKNRSEPSNIIQVLEVIAAIKKIDDLESLSDQICQNTTNVFFPFEKENAIVTAHNKTIKTGQQEEDDVETGFGDWHAVKTF